MADCCEPGCSDEVLCPVHQALADLRAKVEGLGLCVEPDDGEPACFCNDVALYAASVTLDKVLDLIEEAGHG